MGYNDYPRVDTKIDFVLSGELAQQLEEYINRGLYSSKPEIVRDALRQLFLNLEQRDYQRARMNMIQ